MMRRASSGVRLSSERDRAGLLDAVDVGLGEHTAHLAVEVFQARDDEDGVGQAVGDLDEVAHGAWKRSSASLKKRRSSTWSTQKTSAARSTVHISEPSAAMISKARSSPVLGSSAATA